MALIVRSVRRVTHDARHNAFTGACWFRGSLFVAYRQGDSHVCPYGRLVVLRSRDGGRSWDHVCVVRGPGDTRDAHLYTDGRRLYACGFVSTGAMLRSGAASTEDGDIWTSWDAYRGTGRRMMWRPQFFRGKHYCAGYGDDEVSWFESRNGNTWRRVRGLHAGGDRPNECYTEILDDGQLTMLMRCEGGRRHPRLWTSRYPFTRWRQTVLRELCATGPCCWTVDGVVYVGVRCHSLPGLPSRGHREAAMGATSQASVFRIVGGRPELEWVLPAGPGFDNAYLAAARHPLNRRRFSLSFYSDAVATPDPALSQWTHPDLYVADVLCGDFPCLRDGFSVSRRTAELRRPEPGDPALGFEKNVRATGDFLDLKAVVARRSGYVYVLKDIDSRQAGRGLLHLGYDGPVIVWWNGKEVFRGPGNNPAIPDETSLEINATRGNNRLAVAMDTHYGKAEGLFVRWEGPRLSA
jgi:hypothetical protein